MTTSSRKIHRRLRARSAGSLASEGLGSLGSTATSAGSAALSIASDPYLPEVVCRVQQLSQIENGKAVQVCTKTAPNLTGGIGLRKAMAPLRGYVFAEQHPWAYAVAAVGLIGLPILIGYQLGKYTRST